MIIAHPVCDLRVEPAGVSFLCECQRDSHQTIFLALWVTARGPNWFNRSEMSVAKNSPKIHEMALTDRAAGLIYLSR
jgi:hypothetical protein